PPPRALGPGQSQAPVVSETPLTRALRSGSSPRPASPGAYGRATVRRLSTCSSSGVLPTPCRRWLARPSTPGDADFPDGPGFRGNLGTWEVPTSVSAGERTPTPDPPLRLLPAPPGPTQCPAHISCGNPPTRPLLAGSPPQPASPGACAPAAVEGLRAGRSAVCPSSDAPVLAPRLAGRFAVLRDGCRGIV